MKAFDYRIRRDHHRIYDENYLERIDFRLCEFDCFQIHPNRFNENYRVRITHLQFL